MRHRARALTRALDLLDMVAHRMQILKSREYKVTEADDGSHHVVEVVGDTAGELPDRVHPLRLPKLCFALPQRSQIGSTSHRVADRAFEQGRRDLGLDQVVGCARLRRCDIDRSVSLSSHDNHGQIVAGRDQLADQIDPILRA